MKSSLLLPFLCFLPAAARAQTGPLRDPALSPDGTKLVFARATASGVRLFLGKWNGKAVSGAHALTNGGRGDDLQPAWRPDGQVIAFASNRGGSAHFHLFTIRPDGMGLKRITDTPNADETEPSWTPRRFTIKEGAGNPFVPDRSASTFEPSELKLIQRLAGSGDALAAYEKNSSRPTFGVKTGPRFYKILACQKVAGSDGRLLLLREDGSDKRVLDAGMPGDYTSPRVDPSGRGLAFVRVSPTGNALYLAAFPSEGEVFDVQGNSKGLSIDMAAWRKSIRKVRDIAAGGQVTFSPNGEQLAVGEGAEVRLFPRPDTDLSIGRGPSVVTRPDGGVAGGKFFFARDGKTLFCPGQGAELRAVANPEPLADVPNLVAFSGSDEGEGLTDKDRPLLSRNGFVVGGRGEKQMFALYEETDYRNLPVFVSSDSLLHLNHLVFDSLLRETETKNLLPATVEITRHYLQASIQQSRVPALKDDALANAAYWAVVARLLRGEVSTGIAPPPADASPDDAARLKTNLAKNVATSNALALPLAPLLAALPPDAKRLADAEIALITKHADRALSPIFGGALTGVGQPKAPLADTRIDYTQFAPRGHYTRTEALRRFFLASRWLSGAPFRASNAHLRRTLLLCNATDSATQAKLRTVSRIMARFVGESDDRRFLDVHAIARGVYGETIPLDSIGDTTKLAMFKTEVDKLPRPKIAPSGGPAMTLFPSPYTPDAEAMQHLVYDRHAPDVGTEEQPRFFALGLDAMGVLGSDRARHLLDTFTFGGSSFDFGLKESGYQNYARQFQIERARLDALPEAQWKRSFYAQTLWSLKPLLGPQSNPRYRFTQSPAWADKQLHAALGAWAELKHDTMPKQPVAIEAGGEGGLTEVMLEEQPQGVVEPSPELFKRLRELVSSERLALAGAGYLSKESDERLGAFGALLDMVTRLEAKQRAGQPFTPGETEQLRFFGTFLEHLTLISSEGQAQTMEDSDMALVADVSSALSTRAGADLRVLEEGVGHALPLYVAFERDGRRQLARGAAYSYYEFTQPASQRLTDSAWQSLLKTPGAPKMPEWTRSFVSRVGD